MQQKRKPAPDQTTMGKRVLMAVAGVAVLLVLFYFFGHSTFPTDITYRTVGGSGSTYIIQRENPG